MARRYVIVGQRPYRTLAAATLADEWAACRKLASSRRIERARQIALRIMRSLWPAPRARGTGMAEDVLLGVRVSGSVKDEIGRPVSTMDPRYISQLFGDAAHDRRKSCAMKM